MATKKNIPALTIPEELLDALNKNPDAKRYFDSMPPSHKKAYLEYILEAKKMETRIKRIQKTIEMLTDQSNSK